MDVSNEQRGPARIRRYFFLHGKSVIIFCGAAKPLIAANPGGFVFFLTWFVGLVVWRF
jgi:hypothetical protein